jgi:hypothetical protein
MVITGAHMLLYTWEPEQVRAIFRDVFGWEHVDDGAGWLIFALPPAEIGVQPGEGPTYEGGTRHQVSFMCDDIGATVDELLGKASRSGASRRTRAGASPRRSCCPASST